MFTHEDDEWTSLHWTLSACLLGLRNRPKVVLPAAFGPTSHPTPERPSQQRFQTDCDPSSTATHFPKTTTTLNIASRRFKCRPAVSSYVFVRLSQTVFHPQGGGSVSMDVPEIRPSLPALKASLQTSGGWWPTDCSVPTKRSCCSSF